MKEIKQITLQGKSGSYVFSPAEFLSKNGRFGGVFKGYETSGGNTVVVKYFAPSRPSAQGEFRFKCEALYHFGRPDIQDALDFIHNEKGMFLVKQFIPGKSLKSMKPLDISFEGLKEGILQVLDTLDFIHQKGIIHADIKPANIIWKETEENLPERPVLIDFGLARWNRLNYSDTLYSFIYGAPEAVLGMGDKIGPWSDFFSLGVVLYEVIRGEPAYDLGDRENLPAWMEQAQVVLPFPPDERIPKDWFDLISVLCDKPRFRKPPASYSLKDRKEMMDACIARRPADASSLRPMVQSLGTDYKRKKRWRFFGL
jgi:serine/threonine protein kinase